MLKRKLYLGILFVKVYIILKKNNFKGKLFFVPKEDNLLMSCHQRIIYQRYGHKNILEFKIIAFC